MNNTTWPSFDDENHTSTVSPASHGNNGSSGHPLNGSSSNVSNNIENTIVITDLQRNLALYGYLFLFLFGYFGHINAIIIFLRHTLRSVSTSSLFICITISNIIYLLVCIYDFLYIGIGLTPVNSQTDSTLSNVLCRFRSFIQSVSMCSSAWLLLAISIDRWLRIRYPFRVKQLCTRRRVLCGAAFIIICAVTFNSHLLLPSLGSLSGTTVCGPISSTTYSFFFRQVWGILFACLQTIVPTIGLLILTIDIFLRLRAQQQQRQRLNQGRRRAFVDRQMLIIMLTSIFLLFSTQIPLSLFNILLPSVLQSLLSETQALQLTSILNFVASINYATTFYVHCLTSGLFRKEFYDMLSDCLKGRNRRIGVWQQRVIIEAVYNQIFVLQERRIQSPLTVEH